MVNLIEGVRKVFRIEMSNFTAVIFKPRHGGVPDRIDNVSDTPQRFSQSRYSRDYLGFSKTGVFRSCETKPFSTTGIQADIGRIVQVIYVFFGCVKRFESREHVFILHRVGVNFSLHTFNVDELDDVVSVVGFQNTPTQQLYACVEIIHGEKLDESLYGHAPLFSIRVSIQIQDYEIISIKPQPFFTDRRFHNFKTFHVNPMFENLDLFRVPPKIFNHVPLPTL
jgi:hypothetical protein